MASTEFIVILSTCGSKSEADTIASRLVADRAAACVNMIENITSVYQWKGKIEKGTECLMVIKTRATLAEKVEATIKELSSYDCPEVIVLPIVGGSRDYLEWMINPS